MQVTNFRKFRMKYNLSLIEIATYANISIQHLSRIELQLCTITPSTIQKIQNATETLLKERRKQENTLAIEYESIKEALFELCEEDAL